MMRWILLLQEFDVTERKRRENLGLIISPDLRNFIKIKLEKRKYGTFISKLLDRLLSWLIVPWFADFAIYKGEFHCQRNVSSRKKSFFKDIKLLWMTFVQICGIIDSRAVCARQIGEKVPLGQKNGCGFGLPDSVQTQGCTQFKTAGDKAKVQLNELSELVDQAMKIL
ncbi:hypothetical protein Tco_1146910 [Tanacetum coccineum]|uniref:Uncharacterized protein n=1 Tax=Tanacetum coccineum TaxID=301880 RepID=A0ABQ5CWY2_9ASTR